jgi:hypothetical protein
LAEGKKNWQAYFTHTDVHSVRDELKLNRPMWDGIRYEKQFKLAAAAAIILLSPLNR